MEYTRREGCLEPRQPKHLGSSHLTCFTLAVSFAAIHRSIGGHYDGMQKDWRELCVAVTNESDLSKLSSLIQKLIEALDKGERSWRQPIPGPDAIPANQHAA